MDKTSAQRIVRETFKASFDRKRFRDFISELCNGFDESKAQSMLVPDAFMPHVKSCQRLGTFESADGELADVLIVHLTESYKLDRTRTALRDFVAHKLKRGDSYKEAGLVAFVAPDLQWRFSYVRMEYETRRDPETGKIKSEERLTPARRYSYLVGVDEECHTAQTRFLPILQNTSDKPSLAQIEDAFSVESVTNEFFKEYVRLFETTEAALAALVKDDETLRADFEAKHVNTADFTKKLLGQIVFLYFIQKKGWLGVDKGGKWGDGPRHFLRQLATQAIEKKQNLFNDVLEPLFYDTLATDRGHEAWCETFQCRIPFLNGGLFEPLAGYDWENTEITLPNSLLTNRETNKAGDVGTGILDVFDRYNFTVIEDEPLEKEVAIDPEMLGKVFENLIEENQRKGLGTFYTPREIVHYMCQESLINYLDTALNHPLKPIGMVTPEPEETQPLFFDSDELPKAKGGQQEILETTTRILVPREELAEWISQSDQFAHYAAAIVAGTKGDHYPKPSAAIRKYAREIDSLLHDITVCDPAVGSGAFLVGMMNEIVRARMALTPYFNDIAERTAYHFKRRAIQHSLYGVDIDAGAVEIAKLRLWLSLVVDEEDMQQIKPLPNLDYKIVVGNSLFGVEKNLFNQDQFKRLGELKPKFFNESDRKKKAQFKKQIDDLIHDLTNGREVFDYEIYFSEILHGNVRFDVVIGNPPWVSNDSIEQAYKDKLQSSYSYSTVSRFDLSCPFVELALETLMGKHAVASFVLPEHLWLGEYFVSFREHTYKHWREVTSLKEGYFESVNNPASMLIMTSEICNDLVIGKSLPEKVVVRRKQNKEFLENEVQLGSRGQEIHTFKVFFDMDYLTLKTRFSKNSNCLFLDKVCIVTDGVQTANVLADLMTDKTPANPSHYKKALRKGKSIPCRYGNLIWDGWWMLKPEFATKFKRPGFSYDSPKRMLCFQTEEKIIMRQTEPSIVATIDTEGFYFPNSIFQCVVKEQFQKDISLHYVLGLLNSSLIRRFYLLNAQVEGTTKPQLYINILKSLPLLKIENARQKPVISLVQQILNAKQRDAEADVSALERELDKLVYALYGLAPDEIALIEAAR